MRRLEKSGASLGVFALVLVAEFGIAGAQPKVCGNQAALGSWTLANCPQLKDDGVAPDEAAGDGIYTASAQLTAAALLEYKILPTGMWDGSEIKQLGTCPYDAGPKQNDTFNIQVPQPDVARPTLFFFDSRTLSDSSYSPAPSNRSGGDSVMLDAPAGSCPSFVAVGDFQNLYGPNATAAKLSLLGRGVLVGRITAAKPLAAGWRWKVMQQSPGVVREYGPSGWAYAPCTAAFATVSSSVSTGDSVYFLFHAHSGRLQTLVTSSPLDGFSPDGAGSCEPVVDMAAPLDLATPDLSTPSSADLSMPSSDDMGVMPRRPGIHCDCQIGSANSSVPQSWLILSLPLLVLLRRRQARRLRGRSFEESAAAQ